MNYEIIYEFGAIVCEQGGEQVVGRMRLKGGKQYVEVVVQCNPHESRETINKRTDLALTAARACFEPHRTPED